MKEYDYENKTNQLIGAIFLTVGAVLLTTALVVAIVFMVAYNDMVDAREDVNLAESNVEANMQSRAELIPDLVTVVRAAAKHDEKIFSLISDAESALRTSLGSGKLDEITQANNELSKQINNFISFVAREYPDLTAGENYATLMGQLEGSVNRIKIAREEYNAKVSDYNRIVEKAPYCFIAQAFGFEPKEAFAADKEAEKMNLVDMGLEDD